MAAVTAVMLPAVVYLRAHYLVDVPAGLLTGWAAWRILDRTPAGGAAGEL
jgi:membrane-associated phospholipid phosphatase